MYLKHAFHFGFMEMMDNYAVIVCDEGVEIDKHEIRIIRDALSDAYGQRKFGLIANRVNMYSVNPITIKELFSLNELVAGAIVGYSENAKTIAELESVIVSMKPVTFFSDMQNAIDWIEATVSEAIVVVPPSIT